MESSRLFEQLNQFWQKLPQQKLSNITSVLLVVYMAYLCSNIVWRLVPVAQDHGVVKAEKLSAGFAKLSVTELDISQLLKLNLFGVETVKTEAPKPILQPTSAPKTRLNVTLVGLVADKTSDTSKDSVAIIQSSTGQSTYGIADKIDGTSAKVHQIFIDRVILAVSGRYETLMLDGFQYSSDIPESTNEVKDKFTDTFNKSTVATSRSKTSSNKIRQSLDRRDNYKLSQSLRERRKQMFDDPKKLFDVIRVSPHRPNGVLTGYRLYPGKDPTLFNEVGLKRNDLATVINGYDLTNATEAFTVMKELKTMTEATITVVRDETQIDIILAL